MKEFLGKDFLLDTPTAQKLYDDYAAKMPIFDFHCHLNAAEIYEDKKFSSITEAWLGGDHYKWRLMREMGVDEKYVTGNGDDFTKFEKYAETISMAIGNPIYHWTHLELRRFFGIDDILSPTTARDIFNRTNKVLETLTARSMIKMSNVTKIVTTDDPADDLRYHKLIKEDNTFDVEVLPGFRPDKALAIDKDGFCEYIEKLGKAAEIKIDSLTALCAALIKRMDYFEELGCVCSDHALNTVIYSDCDEETAEKILLKALSGKKVSDEETELYTSYVLVFLGREYSRRGWVQQYHIGAMRNNSSANFKKLGPDTGYDCIGDGLVGKKLSALLDKLDSSDELPKTVLYCLNPRENEMLASLINCFQHAGTPGKIQLGSGWWFNDQKDGMKKQMTALSNVALISQFIGMLTDSRSFLSYTRHEYFRRILCNFLGNLIEKGEYPNDIEGVGKIVENICYNNAVRYFTKTPSEG